MAWWLPSATQALLRASWSATKRSEGREEKRRAAAGQSKPNQQRKHTNKRPTVNTCQHTSNGCSLSPHAFHRRIESPPRVTMASAKSQTANYGAILLRNQLKGQHKSTTLSLTGVAFALTRAQLEFSSHAFLLPLLLPLSLFRADEESGRRLQRWVEGRRQHLRVGMSHGGTSWNGLVRTKNNRAKGRKGKRRPVASWIRRLITQSSLPLFLSLSLCLQ